MTPPFDMAVVNDIDRFHLAGDTIDRIPKLGYLAAYVKRLIPDRLIEHREYIAVHGTCRISAGGSGRNVQVFGRSGDPEKDGKSQV
jgi:hypothetical protein